MNNPALPNEVWFQIFKYLQTENDFLSCYYTCSRWKNMLLDIPILHKRFVHKYSLLMIGGQFWSQMITKSIGRKIETLGNTLISTDENQLMSIGGLNQHCFILTNGLWNFHSKLKMNRLGGTVINMPNAIYVFGGEKNPFTSEILRKGTSEWEVGPKLNMFRKLATSLQEKRFYSGNGHKLSDYELILLKNDLIVKYNTKWKHWTKFMKFENDFVSCASVLHKNQLFITGGVSVYGNKVSGQTLIVDLETKTFRKAGSLKIPRFSHGMAFVNFDDGEKLAVFGGDGARFEMNTVETFNKTTESWELSKIKLQQGRSSFGYVSLPS